MNKQIILISILLALSFIFSSAYAQHEDPLLLQEKITPIERISAGVFRIGDITLNKSTRSITFPASLNMDKGMLEYLLVTTSGKVHESLFRTVVRPYDLQLAFLLLGFESTENPLMSQGAAEKPQGEPLEITIEYANPTGQLIKINPNEWIIRKKGLGLNKVDNLNWVFTGSVIMEGQFLAQTEGSIAAIFRDPVAMIDNASAGGESDEIWYVNEEVVPPVGTSLTFIITAHKKVNIAL